MMDQYIGKMLDNRYEILDLIGKGGMANVYKAKCHRLNRLVAVKILRSDLAENEDFRRRFRDESLAVAQLSHANIVSVYDVSHSDDLDYIVMELIDGITLKQYMERRGKMDWREALHFITQIMRGLSHAHSRGIIHRDIKPQNIMVLRDGSVKVADFGIACLANATQTLTQEALGSVHYISPEQARGDRIDVRSDIYSAGVVLYEMLTSRLPFEGDSAVSVAIQHLSSVPLAPRDINPDVPEGLELITMKAMNPNLDKRYASADAMLEDLEKFRKDPNTDMEYIRMELNEPPSSEPTQPLPVSEVKSKTGRKGRLETGESGGSASESDDSTRDKKRIAIILGGFAAALLLILLLFKVIFSGMGGKENPDTYEVPNVVGYTIEQAMNLPGVKDVFEIKQSGTRVDEKYQPGQIIEQDPAAGRTRKGNLVISVVICAEEEKGQMPNLIGKDYQKAKAQLINMNLELEITTESEFSDTQAEGQVIRTTPGAGAELKKGDAVTIVYSKGPETKMVKVLSFLGLSLESAISQAEDAGLRVGQSEYVNSNDPEGAIIGQSLDPNVSVPEGSVIYFTISKGPKMVDVPRVIGMNVEEAIAYLRDKGLEVTVVELPGEEPAGIVTDQNHLGDTVPVGTTVTIWISQGPQDIPGGGNDGGGEGGEGGNG
jgi:serine/threonine-protein kinase